MSNEEFFLLGYIKRPHGFKGEMTALFDADNPSSYYEIAELWVESHNQMVPRAVEKIEPKNNGLVKLKLAGIQDEDTARQLSGSKLFLPAVRLETNADEAPYLHDLVGFSVTDRRLGFLGVIIEVIDHPGNTLLRVRHGTSEKLIPYNAAFVTSSDLTSKQMRTDLPEGMETLWS